MRCYYVLVLIALVAAMQTAASAQATQISPSAYSISGWRVQCTSHSDVLACELVDQVIARANNGVIAGISVQQAGNSKTPTIVVQVPLGTALDEPVRLGMNGGAQLALPFVACSSGGCFARGTLTDALLAQMRDAKQPLVLSYSTYDSNMSKQSIRITLPLDGFSVAYDKLK